VVADAARHYARLWNAEAPRAREIADYWSVGAPEAIALGEICQLAEPEIVPEAKGPATVQLLRTRSARNDSAFAFGPRAHVRELKAAHALLFRSARERIYVEAQFFRSRDASRWLAAALRANPALEVIILIANTPEEIAFEGQGHNPAHRHGEYLQARALKRVVRAGGVERVGLFTLARDARAKGKEREFEEDRGTAFGSGLIHIHSKLVIADDDAVLLSSANINGRSFEWDTELGVLWQEPGDAIAALRGSMWRALSDGVLGERASLADWRKLALSNARSDPEDRSGFIIPYQIGRARRFGRPAWFVPDDLV
jgi:phospholipase D1/2